MMRRFQPSLWLGALVAVGATFWPLVGQARPFRVGQVPNNAFNCRVCHVGDGGSRNAFGVDVESSLDGDDADWSAVFDLDSDGDGFTNGEELGDPGGQWSIGDPDPIFMATNPGNPDDFPIDPDACGNGVIDRGEECDGDALGGATCQSEGFDGGELTCNPQCRIDDSACTGCGDGTLDPGEVCDGDALGGASCQSEGFDGGELGCDAQCGLDTSACTICGNGRLEESEDCDGVDLGGETCESRGYLEGTLGCLESCAFDEGACVEDPGNVCGDGIRRNGEDCDGADLGGETCESRGYLEGTLGCLESCAYDLSQCVLEMDEPNNDPNNDANNDPNNDPNNAPNNDANNDAPNNDPGDPGATGGGGDGGGCATAPGSWPGAGLWLLLGLLGLRALGSRRQEMEKG